MHFLFKLTDAHLKGMRPEAKTLFKLKIFNGVQQNMLAKRKLAVLEFVFCSGALLIVCHNTFSVTHLALSKLQICISLAIRVFTFKANPNKRSAEEKQIQDKLETSTSCILYKCFLIEGLGASGGFFCSVLGSSKQHSWLFVLWFSKTFYVKGVIECIWVISVGINVQGLST